MVGKIHGESMSHFYTPLGDFVEGAGLREARKQGLYVSPTTVIHNVWNNEGMSFWKDGQLISAVLCTPKFPDEEIRAYVGRVKAKADSVRDEAAAFGSALHDAAEHYQTGAYVDQFIQPYLDTYVAWHEANVKEIISREITLVDHALGCAGRTDLIYRNHQDEIVVADLKTQRVSSKGKPEVRQGFLEQLAFYARAYQKREGLSDTPRCQNLLINSTEPSPVVVKDWSPLEVEEGWLAFRALAWIYFRSCGSQGYWPAQGGKWRI
jgi:hypothetical protein